MRRRGESCRGARSVRSIRRIGPCSIVFLKVASIPWLVLSCLIGGCGSNGIDPNGLPRDYRQDMRDFVEAISVWAKSSHARFIVIPQNGQELLTDTGTPDGPLSIVYVAAIDGLGREDLFYGYHGDDIPTPAGEQSWMISFLNLAEASGVDVLITDYCTTPRYVDDSYSQNAQRGYVSFATDRALDTIPTYPAVPFERNTSDITTLSESRNFLYLLDPSRFRDREAYLGALKSTDYDVLLIDAFYQNTMLTAEDVLSLGVKVGGGSRLVIAYVSIGEAEDYRYYWNAEWEHSPPSWLTEENPDWAGNYKVRYWDTEWQRLIYGTSDSYLGRILAAGFDGAYLDIVDAFEYFEDQ
ncbi:endo alpha-1,4 polygalactosaminidase [Candidatus Fermentibacteria bacterium]|nr:endo alpha-1,4 polygalactosaminidase [Candidatus Fermentibacteria bacterium]